MLLSPSSTSRAPLGTSRGSNVPFRSRGVASSTGPASVRSVFAVDPLRLFGFPDRSWRS